MKKLILLIVVCVISLSIILLYYVFFKVAYVETIPMDLEVGDNVGFNLDDDGLHFGKTFPGGVLSREISISHNVDERLKARIKGSGKIGKWIQISDNNFFLENKEVRNLTVSVNVPENAEFGNYTGSLKVFFINSII